MLPPEELATVKEQLARIERMLQLIVDVPKAHLTRRKFAKLAGVSERTVYRRIEDKSIRTKRGRIPFNELNNFTSIP